MNYKLIKENKELTPDDYFKELNVLLNKSAEEVSKDLKILISIKNKSLEAGDYSIFWSALEQILQKEKTNIQKLNNIFPGIFNNVFRRLRRHRKTEKNNINLNLKNNKTNIKNFRRQFSRALEKLRTNSISDTKIKDYPEGLRPIIFFVQNQQYVESLQIIYSILSLLDSFANTMMSLSTSKNKKFDRVEKTIGNRTQRLPTGPTKDLDAEAEAELDDIRQAAVKRRAALRRLKEAAEMVDAPGIEFNPAAAIAEPGKTQPDEIVAGFKNIEQLYLAAYSNLNLQQALNKGLEEFKKFFTLSLLGKSSDLNKALSMAKNTEIGTSKKQGIYELLIKENCVITNNSNVDVSQLENIVARFYPYVKEKLKFNKDAKLNFISDPENAKDPWGKTAYYNPNSMEITVFVDGRHPKDMLRSISHELVHHAQNCRGEFDQTQSLEPGYAQKDPHMRRMEGEAYLLGNGFLVRDFEDYIKSQQNQNLTENKKMEGLTNEQLKTVLENTIKRALEEGYDDTYKRDENIMEEEVVEETEETLEEEVVEEKKEGKKGKYDDGDDKDEKCDHVPCNENFTSEKDQLLFERLTNKWTK